MARPVRYTIILLTVGLCAGLAAFGGWRFARASAPVNGPIVLISVDGMRADRLRPYNTSAPARPAIDALVADGVVFDRAYAHSPQTLPSHASLLTGRLPFETGVRDSAGFTLPAGERTLAEMLADRGYATGGVVSSFLLRKATGVGQGFTLFDADLSTDADSAPVLQRDAQASTAVAEHWLESAGTERAFLFLHLSELTRPRAVAAAAADNASEDRVAAADAAIGRLIKFLKAHQLYDRTTIIVTSDHGESEGEHGESGHGLFTYDETLRVPLVVKQPQGEGHGRRVHDVVQLVDIVPTVLDLAKAPIPGNLRGKTLVPLLDGDTRGATLVYAESLYGHYHHGWRERLSITDGRYRFVSGASDELYDLEKDPGELRNIVDAQPEVASRMRAALKTFAAGPLPKMAAMTPADREMLDAFGYVGDVDATSRPDDTSVDRQDQIAFVMRYREAADAAYARDWTVAIDRLRALTGEHPERADLWRRLALAAGAAERIDLAADAFSRAATLSPSDSGAALGAASALVRARKFEDAKRFAQQALDTPGATPETIAIGHEILARTALAVKELDMARAEADLAEQALPGWPVRAYVDGRIALDRRQYDEALTHFGPALDAITKPPHRPLADLRLLTAEALVGLQRYSEAEYLLLQETKDGVAPSRARALLAAVYKATGRTDEAKTLTH